MNEEKNKHSKLAFPSYGNFGRNEWSFTGTNCDQIKSLASVLIHSFSKEINCTYIDTHHHKADENPALPGMLGSGAMMEYVNQVSYTELRINSTSDVNLQNWFSQADLILVNGNHHAAANQVVIIDEKKKASLLKRMPGLNNIRLILLADGMEEPFDFVVESLQSPAHPAGSSSPAWKSLQSRNGIETGLHQVPVLKLSDHNAILEFFRNKIQKSSPPIYGLVLAGGKSQRMGADKPTMQWHGKEQRYYLVDELKEHCKEVYISCRQDQQAEIQEGYKAIPDSFTGLGPYGAILSAFRAHPDAAWLVIASDLPFINSSSLEYLVNNRVTKSVATAYAQPLSGKPEPLIAIWEPKSYPVLLSFLSRGFSCPKKVLQHSAVTLVHAKDPNELMNVNTPEEKEAASRLMQQVL